MVIKVKHASFYTVASSVLGTYECANNKNALNSMKLFAHMEMLTCAE